MIKTSEWKRWHKVVLYCLGGFIVLLLWIIGTADKQEQQANQTRLASMTQEQKDSVAVTDAAAKRKKQLESNFSQWDGSHRNLEKLIKDNLNDPGSYEHVETRFWDLSDSNIVVVMKYRAKNAFGAKILSQVKARTNIQGEVLKIIDEE